MPRFSRSKTILMFLTTLTYLQVLRKLESSAKLKVHMVREQSCQESEDKLLQVRARIQGCLQTHALETPQSKAFDR